MSEQLWEGETADFCLKLRKITIKGSVLVNNTLSTFDLFYTDSINHFGYKVDRALTSRITRVFLAMIKSYENLVKRVI